MAEIVLAGKKREIGKKSVNKKLRKDGIIPCIYYLKGADPIPFSVEEVALKPLVFTSEAHIINLSLGKDEKLGSIIKDIQFDPVTDRVVHVDFLGVTLGQVLEIQIPINLIGSSIGIQEGGLLQQGLHKLDVECLPRHIPQNLDIDITELSVGDSIHIRDLEFENLTLLNHEDTPVVSIVAPREEEVEEEVDEEGEIAEDTEPEVIAKGKTEEEDKEE